jgi:hypothetical protein
MTLNWGGRALSEEFASRSHLAEATALDLFVWPTGAAKSFSFPARAIAMQSRQLGFYVFDDWLTELADARA